MAQLYLVRHAQASFGSDDYDKLSELGHQQSALLGDYFKANEVRFDNVIAGTMLRHKQTAQGILQSEHEIEADERWNEFDFQAILSAYLELNPHEQPKQNGPRSDFYRILKKAMLAWSENTITCPQESWSEFVERVGDAANRVCNGPHKNVLVVSSGGAIAVYLMQLLGLDVAKAIDLNLQIKNTSIHHFFFNQQHMQLSSFNNAPHLAHPERKHFVTYS